MTPIHQAVFLKPMNTIPWGPPPAEAVEAFKQSQDKLTAAESQAANDSEFASLNPTPLICRSKVRQLLLAVAAETRSKRWNGEQRFTRVSEETLQTANEILRAWAIKHVHTMPSKGRTL